MDWKKHWDDWIKEPWMEAYLEKMADPSDERTDKVFCEEYLISPSKLARWKRDNKQKIAMDADKRRKEFTAQIRSFAWKQLYKRMKEGSDKSIENAFKLIGDMVERREERVEHLTPEDKRERVKKMLDELAERASKTCEKADQGRDNGADVGEGPPENNATSGLP